MGNTPSSPEVRPRPLRAALSPYAHMPDLGLRNQRFHNIAFDFKAEHVLRAKCVDFTKSHSAANGEHDDAHSSTNPSTRIPPGALCGCQIRPTLSVPRSLRGAGARS